MQFMLMERINPELLATHICTLLHTHIFIDINTHGAPPHFNGNGENFMETT